jgi:hypothetical protein
MHRIGHPKKALFFTWTDVFPVAHAWARALRQ